MKNCQACTRKLVAYLHGELGDRAARGLEIHLESCAACRAELDVRRATLTLLGAALEAAPAPDHLIARRTVHKPVINLLRVLEDLWFGPQLKAFFVTSVIACMLFMLSGMLVVFNVVKKEERRFSPPPPVERPKMKLKKPKVKVALSAKPKSTSRTVTSVRKEPMPDVQLPELTGVGAGLAGEAAGFDIKPDFGEVSVFVSGMSIADDVSVEAKHKPKLRRQIAGGVDGYDRESRLDEMLVSGSGESITAPASAPVPASEPVTDYSFAASDVERPNMSLKKLQVPVQAKSKPRLRKQIASKGKVGITELEIEGLGVSGEMGWLGSDKDPGEVTAFGRSTSIDNDALADDLFGVPSEAHQNMKLQSLQVPLDGGRPEAESKLGRKLAEQSVLGSEAGDVNIPEIAAMKAGQDVFYESIDSLDPITLPEVQLFGTKRDAEKDELIVNSDGLFAAAPSLGAAPVADESELADAYLRAEDQTVAGSTVVTSGGMRDSFKTKWGIESDSALRRSRQMQPAVFNPYIPVAEQAFSTFSIDVDTASYGLARQQLLDGVLPEVEQVRTEEFINSFDYDYRPPAGKQTFAVHGEMAPSPFRAGMDVLKIGVKGRRIGRDDHRGAVLTLVIDTSGSMATPERLGLVKQSLTLLLDQLNPEDQVAIVQFGGEARLVLEHTPASDKAALLEAIDALQSGGPTQFDQGLELGYQLATDGFRAGDSNRIIILSDGVANLGELDPDAILEQVATQRSKGIYLSVLGFGAGTYDDDMLERLANKGDGMYAYIDTLGEARRLLVDQLAATLHVIASDVKIQVEFNPARVLRYRQIGYENRQLTKEQFRDDTVDAGEVGSGQSVTALYDVGLIPGAPENEPIATVYVRYRRADNGAIEEISSRVMDSVRRPRFEDADMRFQLAVCTAEFAERLRRSPYAEGTEMRDISGRLVPVALALDLDEQVQELQRLISIAGGLEQ